MRPYLLSYVMLLRIIISLLVTFDHTIHHCLCSRVFLNMSKNWILISQCAN